MVKEAFLNVVLYYLYEFELFCFVSISDEGIFALHKLQEKEFPPNFSSAVLTLAVCYWNQFYTYNQVSSVFILCFKSSHSRHLSKIKKGKKNHDSWHIIFELLVYLSLSFTVMVQMYLQLFKLLCACLLFNCFKSYIDYALTNHLFDLFIS